MYVYFLPLLNNQKGFTENLLNKQLPCLEDGNYQEKYKDIIKTNPTPAFQKLAVSVNILVKGKDTCIITLVTEFH